MRGKRLNILRSARAALCLLLASCSSQVPAIISITNQQVNAKCWQLDHPCRECVKQKIIALEAAGISSDNLRVEYGHTYKDEEHVTLEVRYYGSFYVLDNRSNEITGTAAMGVTYKWRPDGPEWAIVSRR